MQNKLNYISELFKSQSSNIYFEGLNFYLNTDDEQLKEQIRSQGINFDEETNRLLLKIQNDISPNLIPFVELKYFELEYLETEFVILNNDGDYCVYKKDSGIVFNDYVKPAFLNCCNNLISYYNLFKSVISKDFADHFNPANLEIVLFSSVNGIFKIEYESVPVIPNVDNLNNVIAELIKIMDIIELKQFVKNSFFTFSNGTGLIKLNYIFENAGEIILTSKRDYELVSKQFNFEKFKDSLYKEKEKYFSDIREIINKIFSQAIGIPVSISATLFATYKVSDDNVILFLILFTFTLYVFFYIRIQLIYRSDLKEIESDFIRDFEIIKTKSGLDENTINYEESKIHRKIKNSIIITNWLLGTVIILAIFILLFVYHQIFKNEKCCLIDLIISKILNFNL